MPDLAELGWPRTRAGEALAALADAAGLAANGADTGPPGNELELWLDEAAHWLGVELDARSAPYPEVEAMLRGSAPALVRSADHDGVFALLSTKRGRALLLTPDGERCRIPLTQLRDALTRVHGAPIHAELARLAERAQLTGKRRERTMSVLAATRLRFVQVGGVLALRPSAEAPLRLLEKRSALLGRFACVAGAHALSYALGLASWWAIGRSALSARLDAGWLLAWAMLLVSALIVRSAGTWWMGGVAIEAGALLKQRLITGALRMAPDALRAEGVGGSLARVFESHTVERLASEGGFLALFAGIELLASAVVLASGAAGFLHVTLFALTLALTLLLVRRYLVLRRSFTQQRLALTHNLVEAMVGHATRLAQEPRAQRHLREDQALARYGAESLAMDRTLTALQALVPRGWLVLAVAGLIPAVIRGTASAAQLSLSLGGVMLAFAALHTLVEALTRLVDATIAWNALAPLVRAGCEKPALAPPGLALSAPSHAAPVASARGVVYRAPRRAEAVLSGCDLRIDRGARVLLEGASGAGKSTLGALLAGLRTPEAGLVLAGGLDRASLGESGWRRRVSCAPQFHDNHLFTGSLAFNLLMGRSWPPSAADLSEASALCRELGLAPVIERMPAGLFEMVGETGWQLSHGERSRVFLARALLQHSELVVLDESLAALDPGTLELAIGCIERRAKAALVIAHP